MTVDEALLRSTTDARVWAEEFCRAFAGHTVTNREDVFGDGGPVDVGLMIGWFANAIEVGRAAGQHSGRSEDDG